MFDTPESALGFPSFHIGDSVDNAVDGSDYTEIVNDGTTLKVLAANHQEPDFSDKVGFINVYSGMDVLIGHEFIEAVSGTQIENYCSTSSYLFSLSRSTDYDIFFCHKSTNFPATLSWKRTALCGNFRCHLLCWQKVNNLQLHIIKLTKFNNKGQI